MSIADWQDDNYTGGVGFWESSDYAVSRRRAMSWLFGQDPNWKRRKVCKLCHKPFFDPSLNNQREFCSPQCGNTSIMRTYRRKNAKSFGQRACLFCRSAFIAKKGNHVFCRPKCAWSQHNKRQLATLERECTCGCGRKVMVSKRRVRLAFFEYRCRVKYYHRKRDAQLRVKQLHSAMCAGCSKSFLTSYVKGWKARFHSEACRNAHQSRDNGAVDSMVAIRPAQEAVRGVPATVHRHDAE